MPNPQHAILTNLTKYQWYTHLSRTDGADLGVIKAAMADLRAGRCAGRGHDAGQRVPPVRADPARRHYRRHAGRLPALPRLRVARRQGRQGDPGRAPRLDPLRREGPLLGGAVQLPQRGRRPHDRRARDADVHLPQQPRPHRFHRRHREPRTGRPIRPGDHSRRPARGRRLVLHRATLGPRPRLLRRPVTAGPGEHVRPYQGRLHEARGPGPDVASESRRATRRHDRRRQHAQAWRDGPALDPVRVPRRDRRPVLHGLLSRAGTDARTHGSDLRDERPGPRRPHRLQRPPRPARSTSHPRSRPSTPSSGSRRPKGRVSADDRGSDAK